MNRPGFRSFSTVPLALVVWGVLLLATLLFLGLGWSMLQLGLILVPLLIVALAITVAASRDRREGRNLS